MPTALPQPTNPLEFASQAIGVRNALLGNKIQQAKYDAEMAQGNALLGATGADGKTDYAKARATMASDPAAAYGAAQAVREQNAARSDDLANTVAGKNAVGAILSYVGSNPDPAHLYAAKRMAKAIFPGQDVDAIVNQIAQHPDGIAGGVAQLTNSMQAPGQQEANVYGTPGATVNNGQQTIIGTQQSAMNGGQFQPTTTVQQQTSPETNSTPMEVINPDGSHSYVRRDQIVGSAQGRPTVPPEVMGSGRYPTAQPANPGYQSAPAAGRVESQRAAAEVAGHAAGDQFGQAGQLSAGFGDRMYRSQKALQLLQEISPASGKPAELHNRIVNVAVSLGMTTPSDKAAAYDEANKYLTQLAASQPGAAHSDAQLATALAGNPSTHINNLAAQDALRANIALDRRANAAYLAFHQQYPGTEAQVHANEWPAFQNDYTTKKDARAFMFDIMTPEQRARLWSSMDGKQRQAFRSELRGAMATGLVQAPN
ncbi:hypothetical protein [Gluconobacter oxydans]|uniref:hypothetical protein n=1 Tax=Gluconobacter oxydans TaxID=442 RepID=UPI003464B427